MTLLVDDLRPPFSLAGYRVFVKEALAAA